MRGFGSFRIALGFLTVFPAAADDRWPASGASRAVVWFPVIGLLIGSVV